MSFVFLDIQRSLNEYVNSNLATSSGEVLSYEFPVSELGSHTYSIESISNQAVPIAHRAIDGGSSGRTIESLIQIDVFRLPSSNKQPDVAGALKMLSKVTDMFKGSHFLPLKTYGSNPSNTTVGTVSGAIRIDEIETAKQAFDPNPAMRRYSITYKLTSKEVF